MFNADIRGIELLADKHVLEYKSVFATHGLIDSM